MISDRGLFIIFIYLLAGNTGIMASISFSIVFLAYIVMYYCDASLINIPTNLEEFEELGDNLQKLKSTLLDQDQLPNPDVSFSCLKSIIQGIDINGKFAFCLFLCLDLVVNITLTTKLYPKFRVGVAMVVVVVRIVIVSG